MPLFKTSSETVWRELRKVHESFGNDLYADYTQLETPYANYQQTHRICFLLELAEAAMLKLIAIKRINSDYCGNEQEYSDILAHIKRNVKKYDKTAASCCVFHKWYTFCVSYCGKHRTWTDLESKYKERILLDVASRSIAFYIYLNSVQECKSISAGGLAS
jgi:hypothetical protein